MLTLRSHQVSRRQRAEAAVLALREWRVPADVEPQQLTAPSRPQSMRFGTWFQRYSQPVSVTAEYEEGS